LYNGSVLPSLTTVFLERFDMKIKQTVELTFESCWMGWDGLRITDVAGNEAVIKMSDEACLKLESSLIRKCDEIREKAAEAARQAIADSVEEENE